MKPTTPDEIRAALDEACKASGSARKWAEANGLAHTYVSDVLRGSRPPSDRILKALGLERHITYRKMRAD